MKLTWAQSINTSATGFKLQRSSLGIRGGYGLYANKNDDNLYTVFYYSDVEGCGRKTNHLYSKKPFKTKT